MIIKGSFNSVKQAIVDYFDKGDLSKPFILAGIKHTGKTSLIRDLAQIYEFKYYREKVNRNYIDSSSLILNHLSEIEKENPKIFILDIEDENILQSTSFEEFDIHLINFDVQECANNTESGYEESEAKEEDLSHLEITVQEDEVKSEDITEETDCLTKLAIEAGLYDDKLISSKQLRNNLSEDTPKYLDTKRNDMLQWLSSHPDKSERDWLFEIRCIDEQERNRLSKFFKWIDDTGQQDVIEFCPKWTLYPNYEVFSDFSYMGRPFELGITWLNDPVTNSQIEVGYDFIKYKYAQLGIPRERFLNLAIRAEDNTPWLKTNYIYWYNLIPKEYRD